MILYWSSRSPFVRKVMIAAHELGLAGRIETRAEIVTPLAKSETLRAANPLGMLPTMQLPDGTTLYDSHVICDYLDALAGGRLIPSAYPGRGHVLRREALADGMLDKALKWLDERFRPEATRAQDKIDSFARDVGHALDTFDKEGAALSPELADLGTVTLATALSYLDFRFAAEVPWRIGRPALAAWYAAVEQRPSMQATAYRN